MRELILTLAIAISPLSALAESAEGVWKTEVNDDGGYLEVTIGPCESDSAKTCGTITKAFSKQGAAPDYKYLGKLMVWDMTTQDGVSYAGGKIWHPEDDKTYNSKMKLTAAGLDVEGCLAFICSGQDWTRVQ